MAVAAMAAASMRARSTGMASWARAGVDAVGAANATTLTTHVTTMVTAPCTVMRVTAATPITTEIGRRTFRKATGTRPMVSAASADRSMRTASGTRRRASPAGAGAAWADGTLRAASASATLIASRGGKRHRRPAAADAAMKLRKFARALVVRGQALVGRREYASAIQDFDEAIRLDPESSA